MITIARLKIYLIAVFCVWGIISCKGSKVAKNTGSIQTNIQRLIDDTKATNLEFEKLTLSGKASVEVPDKNVKINLSYRVNMISDSLIWMRISKFGIEAARVKITTDSIFVIDRVNDELVVSDLSRAKEYIGMEVGLDALQDVLLGNFHLLLPSTSLNYGNKKGIQSLQGFESGTNFVWFIDQELKKLVVLEAEKKQDTLSSQLRYEDFKPQLNTQVPFRTNISVSGKTSMEFELDHKRLTLEPEKMSLSFRVPKRFDRRLIE